MSRIFSINFLNAARFFMGVMAREKTRLHPFLGIICKSFPSRSSIFSVHALRGREDGKQTTNLNFATGNLGKKTEEPFEL